MKSRYCYCPATAERIGQRATILYRLRRWLKIRRDRRNVPDVFTVTGYYPPVFPGK